LFGFFDDPQHLGDNTRKNWVVWPHMTPFWSTVFFKKTGLRLQPSCGVAVGWQGDGLQARLRCSGMILWVEVGCSGGRVLLYIRVRMNIYMLKPVSFPGPPCHMPVSFHPGCSSRNPHSQDNLCSGEKTVRLCPGGHLLWLAFWHIYGRYLQFRFLKWPLTNGYITSYIPNIG
jgi:hypothetical protein